MSYRKVVSWLKREPDQYSLAPNLDKWILFFLKIIYLTLRLVIRSILGKRRRDQFYLSHYLNFTTNLSPSVWLFFILCKITKFFRLGRRLSVIINVPKYGYKTYCPMNREDFINLTIREDEIIEKFQPKEGETVVDVGSNLGRYTMIASIRVGQTGKVVAIEPHPSNFNLLDRNVKLNTLRNVIMLNNAAYSKSTILTLYLPNQEQGTIHYSVFGEKISEVKNLNVLQVNADTLDNLLKSIGIECVDWIKIDVEGAEFEVLKGACNVISKSEGIAILLELHGSPDVYIPKLNQLLQAYNFKIDFDLQHKGGEKHVILRKAKDFSN